jgi:hypothetical protein
MGGVLVEGFAAEFCHPIPAGVGHDLARVENDGPVPGNATDDVVGESILDLVLTVGHHEIGGSETEDRSPRQGLRDGRWVRRHIKHETHRNSCRSDGIDCLPKALLEVVSAGNVLPVRPQNDKSYAPLENRLQDGTVEARTLGAEPVPAAVNYETEQRRSSAVRRLNAADPEVPAGGINSRNDHHRVTVAPHHHAVAPFADATLRKIAPLGGIDRHLMAERSIGAGRKVTERSRGEATRKTLCGDDRARHHQDQTRRRHEQLR